MITKMKKIHIIVEKKDVTFALERLRDLGVVHIEHQDDLKSPAISELKDEMDVLIKVDTTLRAQKTKVNQKKSENLDARVDLILERLDAMESLGEEIVSLNRQIKYWEEWGDFEPADIQALKAKGVHVALCEATPAQLKEVPEEVIIEGIKTKKKKELCVLIYDNKINAPVEMIDIPAMSLSQMKAQLKQNQEKLDDLQIKMRENTRYIDFIEKNIAALKHKLQFEEAKQGMLEEEELTALKGFCPVEDCEAVEAAAKGNSWAALVEDVTEEDNPPTLLKNPKWVNLSKPALDVIEILPGYKEFDVSPVFLIFFTLFFGMLIGDAGYGALFFSMAVFSHIKFGKRVNNNTIFHLVYLLTGFTMLWGVLTGTYFGQQWLPSTVKAVVPWLNNPENVQWLCFTIAVVHLTIARLWSAVNLFPSLAFLSQIGWTLIVWGMYFVANMFVLNQQMPAFASLFLWVGIVLALVFMFPIKQLGRLGQEIIPFILGVIGAGTDIVSYIRLFAVGLATVAVADAANSMPEALGIGGYVLFFVLHALNLVLALMAILVHAIRLNVLEFSGHLGLEWAGQKYAPFKK